MPYHAPRALELLRIGTGHPSTQFREGQEEAIRHVVEGRGRLLVVQKTGWGKSFVYFIATKLLREDGKGPAILISPLLSLMRNQIAAAQRMGVRAVTIHSGNTEDWDQVEEVIRHNEADILLISPERLANERFRAEVLGPVAGRISLLVVDEALHLRLGTRFPAALPLHRTHHAIAATESAAAGHYRHGEPAGDG